MHLSCSSLFWTQSLTTLARLPAFVPKSTKKQLISDLATNKLPLPYWDGPSLDRWLDKTIKDFIKGGGRIRSQAEIDKANEHLCPGYTQSRKKIEMEAIALLKALSQRS